MLGPGKTRSAREVEQHLKSLGNPTIAEHSQRFFKTGKGEYGEGDVFLGIRVPVIRQQARELHPLPMRTVTALIKSKYHEVRLFALLSLVDAYEKAEPDERRDIYRLYLSHTRYINNWDLVDLSAHKIVGPYLQNRSRATLYRLSKSRSLWERRIAVIATFRFIAADDFDDSLKLAGDLLTDGHDLMHKAVGWMLREIGNRDRKAEERFLKRHYKAMPRTMLRYAIERFPEGLRKRYLLGRV